MPTTTQTLRLSLPGAFYAVTATVSGSDVTVTDVAATDMSFRSRLARASYESELRAHLTELGMAWDDVVVKPLVAKANRRAA